MPPLPPLNLDPTAPPSLGNAVADAYASINKNVLTVLRLVCQAEAVSLPAECDCMDPAAIRREVFFGLKRLGYLSGAADDPASDKQILDALRESLPIEAESLAVLFAVRALCQTSPATAHEEVTEAVRWAQRAVLSPL